MIRTPKSFPLLLSLVGLLAGCATAAPGSRPADMSAADHALVAAAQRADALDHEARYDPAAARARPATARVAEAEPGSSSENPTLRHLEQANRLREHARQHEDAARALRGAEEAACAAVPEAADACPLHGAVVGVEPTAGGARLLLADGVRAEALLERIRCHVAHARTEGFRGMEGCPLYVAGLGARVAADGHAIELAAESGGAAAVVYGRARTLAAP